MPSQENKFRKLQRSARDLGKRIEKSGLTESLNKAGSNAHELASKAYQNTDLDDVVERVVKVAKKTHSSAKEKASKIDERLSASSTAKSAIGSVKHNVVTPVKRYLDGYGVTEIAVETGRWAEEKYGATRSFIKPYFEPEDPRELLENTRKELTHITACILQISYREAEGWVGKFGKLVSAKVAGVTSTVTLFSLVSMYGTAGTGTAIASLSGAAATNATLASIGGLVGGGMAAGALVMSGFGILVGIGAYELMSSTARDFESLPKEDKQIVSTSGLLIAAIQQELDKDDIELTADEAAQFLAQSLTPFKDYLEANEKTICSRLDVPNSIAYRQHVLKDFEPVVIQGFRSYSEKAPASIKGLIGGVFYALLTNSVLDGSSEQALVLEALRRSTFDLREASEAELADYLHSLSPEQLRGVANNVKGIYHELRFVESYNFDHEDSYAVLHESTTHQGSDVQILSKESGELLNEYQLKATDSASYVRDHQSRYSEIDVRVTEEVSLKVDGAESSGHSNADMNSQVNGVFSDVADNTMSDRIVESAELAGLASAGLEALTVLRGQAKMNEAGKRVVGTVVQAAAATGITAFLFS